MSTSTPQKPPMAAAKAGAKAKPKKEKKEPAGQEAKNKLATASNAGGPLAQQPRPIRRLYAHCGKNRLFLVIVPNGKTVESTIVDIIKTHNQLYPQDNAIPTPASSYRLQAEMKPAGSGKKVDLPRGVRNGQAFEDYDSVYLLPAFHGAGGGKKGQALLEGSPAAKQQQPKTEEKKRKAPTADATAPKTEEPASEEPKAKKAKTKSQPKAPPAVKDTSKGAKKSPSPEAAAEVKQANEPAKGKSKGDKGKKDAKPKETEGREEVMEAKAPAEGKASPPPKPSRHRAAKGAKAAPTVAVQEEVEGENEGAEESPKTPVSGKKRRRSRGKNKAEGSK